MPHTSRRRSSWRRLLVALVPAALALGLPTGALAGGPIVVGGCVNRTPTLRFLPLHPPGQPFEVLAPAADHVVRARVARDLGGRLQPAWPFFQSSLATALGRRVRPPAPPRGIPRYQIFIVSPSVLPAGATGADLPYCGAPRSLASLVSRRAASPAAVAARELFHAFEQGAVPAPTAHGWWLDTLSEWAAAAAIGIDRTPDGLDAAPDDAAFLSHPDVPLDGPAPAHRLGAMRYAYWLEHALGRHAFLLFVGRTFEHVTGPSGWTDAVTAEEARSGRTLVGDLGRFWADHLSDDGDDGPAARHETLLWDGRTIQQTYAVNGLAARLLTIEVPGGPGDIHVSAHMGGTGGELWVQEGDSAFVVRHDIPFDEDYCTNGQPKIWPGRIRMAYTAPAGGGTLDVSVSAGTQPLSCDDTPPPPPPPPPPSSGCPLRDGVYDTAPTADPTSLPRVYLTLICQGGTGPELVLELGGALVCPDDTPAPLSPSGAGQPLRTPIDAARGVDVSYTYGGATISGHVQMAGGAMTGTLTYQRPGCNAVYPFVAPWRSP